MSIANPTEAPYFGHSIDDGLGLTIIGYFKIKEEKRKILHHIMADGYDPSTDTLHSEIDVQKHTVTAEMYPTTPRYRPMLKSYPRSTWKNWAIHRILPSAMPNLPLSNITK